MNFSATTKRELATLFDQSTPNGSVILSWSCYNHDTTKTTAGYSNYNVSGVTPAAAITSMLNGEAKALYIEQCEGLFCGQCSVAHHASSATSSPLRKEQVEAARISLGAFFAVLAVLYGGATLLFEQRNRSDIASYSDGERAKTVRITTTDMDGVVEMSSEINARMSKVTNPPPPTTTTTTTTSTPFSINDQNDSRQHSRLL